MPISAEMLTHLSSGITTLCVAVKITEIKPDGTDGDILRFVNHTKDLEIDSETYTALPLPPRQLQQTEGLDPDNTQITAILSGSFSSANLRAHKWQAARVEYSVVNYNDTTMGAAIRKVGYIGKTGIQRFTATPEIRSLSQLLEQPIGDVTSEDCRTTLGSSLCTVNLSGYTQQGLKIQSNATVTGVTDKQRFTVSYPSSLLGTTVGLKASYFNGTDLVNLALIRVDENVDFNFGLGSPAPGIAPSFYSIRWEGKVTAQYSETYTFSITHDDGVKLWVNGTLVIDQWGTTGTHTGTIAMTAGVAVDIKIEFFNAVSPGSVTLKWQSASQALQVIPSSRLSLAAVTTAPDDHWTVGNAEWLTGDNQYQRIRVLQNTGNDIILYLPTNKTIQVGDTLKLTAGCDGKRATCRDKYANVINLQSEPDTPGRAALFAFPA